MIHNATGDSVARAWLRRACLASLLIAAGLMAASDRAQAQNLVQDPNFTNGFNAYTNVCCNVTTIPGDKGSIAVLPGGSTLSQLIPTSADSLYLVSFFANFSGPGTYIANFGNVTFQEDATKPGLFSFTATASGSSTALNFFTSGNSNTEFLSNLDVELQGAPAPVPGTGIVSFCAIFAALALHRVRRTRLFA
jgi:hypothetical protein